MPDVEIMIEDSAAEDPEWFQDMVRGLWKAARDYLQHLQLPLPKVQVSAAIDVWSTATRLNREMGLEADRRTGVERVGGVVAGKCLTSQDGLEVRIVVPDQIVASIDGSARLMGAGLVAHELGHVVYAAQRRAAIGATADVWLPWEVAGMITVVAAEEYRVNQFASVIVGEVLKPTDREGAEVKLDQVMGHLYREGLPAALGSVDPGLPRAVAEYRNWRLPLEDMWSQVARVSEEATLYLAHTEAFTKQPLLAVEGLSHPGADLLLPVWRPLFDHLESSPIVPELSQWRPDRTSLVGIGSDGFTEVWRSLGITARPEGQGFFLAVADPPPKDQS